MKTRDDALGWFLEFMRDGRMTYEDGALWRHWEPRRNWLPERKRAEKLCSNGYLVVRSVVDYFPRYVMAHRLIWSHLRGTIPQGHVINHLNSNRSDNRIENLECVTSVENIAHAMRVGRMVPWIKGESHPAIKITDDAVARIRSSELSNRELAEIYRIHPHYVYIVRTGRARAS